MSDRSDERIAHLSLRLDAVHCALVGTGVVLRAPSIATVLPVPMPMPT